jgi:uncharacterized membrane protein YuzA (DUF378 family)
MRLTDEAYGILGISNVWKILFFSNK